MFARSCNSKFTARYSSLNRIAAFTMRAGIYEGIFAIHKPSNITSAQVIRDTQDQFDKSDLFQSLIRAQKARLDADSHNQKQKRRKWKSAQASKVKMGHGGTLDPMATGVLILGVGTGTKCLNKFLECTKSYECVVLFGAASDSYDALGKLVGRKGYEHITKQKVEETLDRFRGTIMQRPPIFSAIRINGKRAYEYAREGLEMPREIAERPVTVEKLEMVEWMEGGSHKWKWPTVQASEEDQRAANKFLNIQSDNPTNEDGTTPSSAKRQKVDAEVTPEAKPDNEAVQHTDTIADGDPCPAPACRLRMTVTSGFYVRSLCHDLGLALDSLALMSSLVRTRQADFVLGENVLEYSDLDKGEEVWGPQVKEMLTAWQEKSSEDTEQEVTRFDSEPKRGRNQVRSAEINTIVRERRNSSSEDE